MIEPKRLKGELWSFLRQVLSQGQDIHLDYLDKPYESKSARLDAAARERAEQLEAMLDAAHEHQWVISWPFDRCVCGDTRASNVRPTSDAACEHEWKEIDAYPFREARCTKCGVGKTLANDACAEQKL